MPQVPSRKPTEDELASYREVFALFDQDNSGTISSAELAQVMHSFGQSATKSEIDYIMEKVDRDRSGTIDFEEFVFLMSSRKMDSPGVENPNISDEDAELWEAFRVFDKDGSGNISFEELKLVMTNLGERLTNEELTLMIKEADLDGDNEISFEEFKKMILGR